MGGGGGAGGGAAGGAVVVVGAATRVGLSSAKVAPTMSATTATVMNTYDNVTPTSARSRPFSRECRICESARCPKIAPTGAKTNANTTDNVANTLASSRGCIGAGAGGGGGPGIPVPPPWNGFGSNGLFPNGFAMYLPRDLAKDGVSDIQRRLAGAGGCSGAL